MSSAMTTLQETILCLLAAVDPEPVDGITLMAKAAQESAVKSIVDLAKAVGDLDKRSFLRCFETSDMRYYVLTESGRGYINAGLAKVGGSIEQFQEVVRQMGIPKPGVKPC